MVRKALLSLLLVLALVGGGAFGVAAQDDDWPDLTVDDLPFFEYYECGFDLYRLVEEEDIDCGYLYVLEDRSDPENSNIIALAVAIIYAPTDNPEPDPIIYLEGGPGGNAVAFAEAWPGNLYLANRDLILFDQRGTGLSEPALICEYMVEVDEDDEDFDQLLYVEACRDAFEAEGVNLQAYNSAESAADIVDLAIALEYEEVNLYGISYGTRLALTAMRDYPDMIRSVIIDSVYPPEVQSWEEYGANTADVFSRFFTACADDPDCDAAYPNLENVFYGLVAELDDEPAEYSYEDFWGDGEEIDGFYTGQDLLNRLFQIMYDSNSLPFIPQVIYDIVEGYYPALDELESLGGGINDEPIEDTGEEEEGGDFTEIGDGDGMNLSVECQEEVAFLDLETALANVPTQPAVLYENSVDSIQGTFEECEVWGVLAGDPIEALPVRSDIPTLVMAGRFDPITPAAWAASAASYLPNSFYYVLEIGGHGVVDFNACTQGIARDFLNDPFSEPDTSCLDDYQFIEFALP